MSFAFLSGLAYLLFCLLIAASGARKKCLRAAPAEASTIEQSTAGNDGPARASSPVNSLLLLSGLISLASFLFMPCGTLPALIPVSGGALIAVIGLAAASVFLDGWDRARWRRRACRRGGAPLCLGVSLAAIACYARQRGVPGDLYALDAYVAMPVLGVAEGAGKPGIGILAAVCWLALWKAQPERRLAASGGNPDAGEALLAALADELWRLALIAFWVCLFFPFSLAHGQLPGIFALGSVALDALVFWGKILGLAWFLRKLEKKYPRGAPFHASILIVFLALGAGLLLAAGTG